MLLGASDASAQPLAFNNKGSGLPYRFNGLTVALTPEPKPFSARGMWVSRRSPLVTTSQPVVTTSQPVMTILQPVGPQGHHIGCRMQSCSQGCSSAA